VTIKNKMHNMCLDSTKSETDNVFLQFAVCIPGKTAHQWTWFGDAIGIVENEGSVLDIAKESKDNNAWVILYKNKGAYVHDNDKWVITKVKGYAEIRSTFSFKCLEATNRHNYLGSTLNADVTS